MSFLGTSNSYTPPATNPPITGTLISYADMSAASTYITLTTSAAIIPFAPPTNMASYSSGKWASGRWTCAVAGVWKVSCSLHMYNNSNSATLINSYIQIFKNNSGVNGQVPLQIPTYGGDTTLSFVECIPLSVGDVVDVRALIYPSSVNCMLGDGVGRLCCCLMEFMAPIPKPYTTSGVPITS